MSHHFDSPTAIEDGRLNLCDVFAFAGAPGSSVLVMTVNPDAGRSSPASFRSDAVYEFAIDTGGGTDQNLGLRIRFDEVDSAGRQSLRVLHAEGGQLSDVESGQPVASGETGSAETLAFAGLPDGKVWAGEAADPFWADGAALLAFLQAARDGHYRPEVFAEPTNIFEGRNITGIVLEIPDSLLGDGRSSVWATITVVGDGPTRRVSRMGQPMLRPLFFNVPGQDTEDLNAGNPADDHERYGKPVLADATTLASVAGDDAPADRARQVAAAFLPDVLGYTPGEPVQFHPGGGNGRALTDDAFGTALQMVTGRPVANSASPTTHPPAFPYLAPPHTGELPSLTALFGLRSPDSNPARPPAH